jgi:pseudaminic acid cytidylyltransferase
MESIAIIPARGGSKRILRKNIRPFAGKPAIARAIDCAEASNLFSRIIVSTDDQEIATIARDSGAEVPFIRSSRLSDDHTTTIEVIADALKNLKEASRPSDLVCCVYPVTPLLNSSRLKEAKELLIRGDWDFVFGAIQFESPIERAFSKNATGEVLFRDHKFIETRTQDLASSYHDSGQFYFGRRSAWILRSTVLGAKSTFIQLDKHEVIDIDTEEDWALAEHIFESRKINKNFQN